MSILRRRMMPTAVRARLDLPVKDALLAAAALRDGSYAATSRFALHRIDEREVTSWPWTEVDKAALDPETSTIRVTLVTGTSLELELGSERNRSFAQTLRERVQNSVVGSSSTQLETGEIVRVAVRRDAHGELFSQVIAPGSVDLADPATAGVVDELYARVRQAAGLL